ncbi:MAG: GNAT family N-acetyltransferase [Variovorax sp.]|nr:MAG: GNAT family N-acetyltransferase [Variovorax sp.]
MSMSSTRPAPPARDPAIRLIPAVSASELDAARAMFRRYAAALDTDLAFQHFEEELATLPGDYASPRGALWLAVCEDVGAADNGTRRPADESAPTLQQADRTLRVAGCCALRPLDTVDYPNAAEMKRLYVHPDFRGLGLGRQLAEAVLDAARAGGYACVLLDTLDDMESARALYEDLGFAEVPPYYHNPIPGAHYLKVDLF